MTVTEQLDRQHQADLQRLRGLRLLDDDFMTKCFEGDPKYIEFVLRIILEMPDLVVVDVRTQVFMENLLKRSVRMDILATDSRERKINVEIQRSDKGAGRKRARYNSSMMDVNLLWKGGDFDALPETYVVFITENDVIGKGKPLYHIGRYIFDTDEVFDDGSHILYVNGAYRDDSPIGKLMHDFSCTNPDSMYYDVLRDRVRFFKESKEGVATMCKILEDMRNESFQEGIEVGRKEGAADKEKSTILKFLAAGKYTLEDIADTTGLSVDKLKKWAAEISDPLSMPLS